MYKYGLKQKSTFDDIIIYLNNQPKIKYPNIVATKIMNSYYLNNIDNWTSSIKANQTKKSLVLDKATQKSYPLQNYDIFPDMYHIIDAQAIKYNSKYRDKTDKMVQTIRYILKDIPTPYSSYPPSDKPSSPPSELGIPKPTPEPTPQPSREPTPTPTPSSSRSPTPPSPVSSDTLQPPSIASSVGNPIPVKGTSIHTPTESPPPSSRNSTPVKGNSIHTPTESPPPSSLPSEEDIDVYELMGIPRPGEEASSASSLSSRRMRERSRSRDS